MTKVGLLLILSLFFAQSEEMQDSTYPKSELIGKFIPSSHPDFVKIPSEFTIKSNIYLRKEALDAFEEMEEAALEAGFDLEIISATRIFSYQEGIWTRKWNRLAMADMTDMEKVEDIMTYSSMPGTSRHHWGTDIDLNNLNNSFFESGQGKELYEWLTENAPRFGFGQTYTSKESGRKGYNEEKWHWSYMPIAGPMLEQYNSKVSYSDISGFPG
jgi:LAS superfamily LD-carboxypeptidase LdcB